MSIEIPMDLELMWVKEKLDERDNQILGLVAEKSKQQEKLTLRDHFASLVMQRLLVVYSAPAYKDAAKLSYQIADAMLKAREVNNG